MISVGEFYHNWVTNAVTDLIFKRLEEPRSEPRYRWDALLNPVPANQPPRAAAAAAGASSDSILPEPVREIVAGVSDVVSDAAAAVSEIVESVVSTKPKATKGAKKENGAATPRKATAKKAAPPRVKKTEE